jgi:hypothetical protein
VVCMYLISATLESVIYLTVFTVQIGLIDKFTTKELLLHAHVLQTNENVRNTNKANLFAIIACFAMIFN